METINYKIAGVAATRILGADKKVGNSPTMSICNIKNTAIEVSLYYTKENYSVDNSGNAANSVETFFILKSFSMPNNTTLTLDKSDLSFNNKGFDLYIQLGAAIQSVDVIITI